MGVGTILKAKEICLLAFGEQKAAIIRRAVEGEVAANIAASFLQEHPAVKFYIDVASAAELTRIATPWLTGNCKWDEMLKTKAAIWLSRKLQKPISKLTAEDYAENGLSEMLKTFGSAESINKSVFERLMGTITDQPVGKRGGRKVIVFSPHPDDDVICMGGTITKLAEQGHDVYVAYMISGYLSVFDHDVQRYADFVRSFNNIFGLNPAETLRIEQHIDKFLFHKRPGDVDSPEIRSIKSLIRRGEALDAAKFCGVKEDHIYFLDLPFYNTGKVQKLSVGPDDVAAVLKMLDQIKPEVIFAAGDMSDPHGTHSLCQEAGLAALEQYKKAGNKQPEFWLYRGAWQEWEPEQIEMAVPLSVEELVHKRYAIFRHQSQKDRAMFPGPYDSREFWQRAEERNQTTAAIYNQLGLPEYHAIEAFAPLSDTAGRKCRGAVEHGGLKKIWILLRISDRRLKAGDYGSLCPKAKMKESSPRQEKLLMSKLARPILLGNPEKIEATAKKIGVSLEGIKVINLKDNDKLDAYAAEYMKGRDNLTPRLPDEWLPSRFFTPR